MAKTACSTGGACGCASPAAFEPSSEETCSGGESFALMVLGDSMAPEFNDGEIIVIEPDGATRDGSFVLAFVDGEWTFRQLKEDAAGWRLQALNPAWPSTPLPDLAALRGVIIQKALPGRRRASKRYI